MIATMWSLLSRRLASLLGQAGLHLIAWALMLELRISGATARRLVHRLLDRGRRL